MLESIKTFNFKKFIWDRYDPYDTRSISVGVVYKDFISLVLIIIGISIWLRGFKIFLGLLSNNEMFVSGVDFICFIITMAFTVCGIVISTIELLNAIDEGELEIWDTTVDKILKYKLLKR